MNLLCIKLVNVQPAIGLFIFVFFPSSLQGLVGVPVENSASLPDLCSNFKQLLRQKRGKNVPEEKPICVH